MQTLSRSWLDVIVLAFAPLTCYIPKAAQPVGQLMHQALFVAIDLEEVQDLSRVRPLLTLFARRGPEAQRVREEARAGVQRAPEEHVVQY